MNITELSEKIAYYKSNITSRAWTKTKESVSFSNEYITVKRLDSSNKWLGAPHASEMEKMWSIIVELKKDFRLLPKYRELSKILEVKITPVIKGELQGCYGIRIYGMKKEPTSSIVYDILNFIFS